MAVFATHATGYWLGYTGIRLTIPLLGIDAVDFFQYGYLGVPLFFLLSGYLLTWTEESRVRKGAHSIRAYATRRALRLIPAYWVSILVVVIVWPTHPSVLDVITQGLFLVGFNPYSLTFQGTFHPLDHVAWSLTAEVVFYFCLPFIVTKLPRLSQRLVLFVVLMLISLIVRVYISQNIEDLSQVGPGGFTMFDYLYFLPIIHLYLFIAGVLLRTLTERSQAPTLLHRRRQVLPTAMLVGSVLFLTSFPYWGMAPTAVLKSPAAMLPEIAVIAFFASAILNTPGLRRVLNWKPLIFVGTISYSIFLLHVTVIMTFYRSPISEFLLQSASQGVLSVYATFGAATLTILTLTCGIAYASYCYIERPFFSYKPR